MYSTTNSPSNEPGIQEETALITISIDKPHEWYGRFIGTMAHIKGVHMAITVSHVDFEVTYELTSEGVNEYSGDVYQPLDDPNVIEAYVFPVDLETAEAIHDRAHTLAQAKARISTVDLWRCLCGMPPHGLICSTFVYQLLGFYPNFGYTEYYPEDVMRSIREYYDNGLYFTW